MSKIVVVVAAACGFRKAQAIGSDLKDFRGQIGGGYIEALPLPDELRDAGIGAYVDEEGRLKGLPANRAPALAAMNIRGAAVFFSCDPDGDEVSLTDDQINQVFAWLR